MYSSESWKTLSWNGKNALVNIFSMLLSLSLEIQTLRGIALRHVLLTAIQKKPSRHSSDLNISYCWGEGRAWPVLQIYVEGEPMARQELWEKQWGNKSYSAAPFCSF